MLLQTLFLVLSSRCVWTRNSEPFLGEVDPGLFRGSDKYDFSIHVPPAGVECFWHFAHQSGSFYLTYMVQRVAVMASDHRLLVTVSSPQGALVASRNEAVGLMDFRTQVTGFYKLCLGNHNYQFGGIRVFVSFGVVYEGSEETQKEAEEEQRVLNITLADIEKSLGRLRNQIFHMWRHYNFDRMRKGKDHYLLQSNLSYVTWWSALQTFVIILYGPLQLVIIKRLFHTDSRRPRC